MKALRIARTAALLMTFGVFLAGCSSPVTVSVLAPTIQGPPGHQFALSLLKAPSGEKTQGAFLVPTKHGAGIQQSWYVASRYVWAYVYELTNTVPGAHIDPLLRSFLPLAHNARMVTWQGYPATTESSPCSTQGNSCSGSVSALVVLDNNSIYEIIVNAPTDSVAQTVIKSFRLIN
jgi:hypothetical protein